MSLDENDVKTLVPPMGLVRKILRLLPKVLFIQYQPQVHNSQIHYCLVYKRIWFVSLLQIYMYTLCITEYSSWTFTYNVISFFL